MEKEIIKKILESIEITNKRIDELRKYVDLKLKLLKKCNKKGRKTEDKKVYKKCLSLYIK